MNAIAPPAYAAKLGKRPPFCSERDAAAYDAGFRQFAQRPRFKLPFPGTPAWRGWMDAQEQQLQLNAERAAQA